MTEGRKPPSPDEDSAARDLEMIEAARQEFHDSGSSAGSDAAITRASPGDEARHSAGPATDSFTGYEVVRELSHGGQGVVYQAIEKATKRKVAIKVLLEGPYASASARRRFEREIELVASLNHPNIVAIYHSGLTPDGRQFCVMDYIRGVSLTRYVREQKLPLEAALQLFGTVCEAVQYAHNKGVIHRDLKPANIVVDADGNPKVLDFGLAKQVGGPEQTLISVTGQVVGTLPYLSPEQARGNPDEIDTRTDVYALGVILYEMLTGGYPYPVVGQMADVLRHIAETEPTPPSREWKSDSGINQRSGRRLKIGKCPIDDELQTIALKALAKARDRRYQSARALARDIGNYLSGEAIEAKRDSALYVLRKTLRRYKLPATIAAAFVITIAISVVALSIMYRNQVALRAEADAEAARADKEKAVAQAVNAFLTEDLLAAVAPSPESGQGKDVLMRDVLDEAAERIEEASRVGGRFEELPLVEASIRATLGSTYRLLGEYGAAEPHLERARLLRRRELGEEHPSTLSSVSNLAVLYNDQGRYDEAEPLYVKTLEISKRVSGEEHPSTIGHMNNLALLYVAQGRYDEAERLFVKTLEIMKRVLGEEHPDTLKSMNNLASLYVGQGRYDEAEPLYVKTLETRKRVLSEEHPDTLTSMNNLALLYQSQGRYDESAPLLVKTLEIHKRVFGEEHPRTLTSMSNLAVLYHRQGRYDESAPLYVKTLQIRKRVLGEEHPHTLRATINLALLYQDQSRYDEAEPMYVKTLAIMKRVLGEEHPDPLMTTSNLANLYRSQGRYDEAERLLVKTLETRKRVLGEEHPNTLDSMNNIANLYWSQRRYAEAEPLYVKTLETRKRVLGEEHPDTLSTLNNLASLRYGQGRYAEAEPLYVKTLEIKKRVLGAEHPGTLASITNLGALYLSMKRFDDARAMFESSLPIKRRVLGMGDPCTRFALKGLAQAYDGLDRGDDALPLWRELQEFQLAQVENPDASAQVLNEVAWDLLTNEHAELRDPVRALPLARRAVDKAGGVDPAILDTLALAQHLTGDTPAAIETEKKALSLLAPDAPIRGDLEAALARFEAALKEADTADEPGGG